MDLFSHTTGTSIHREIGQIGLILARASERGLLLKEQTESEAVSEDDHGTVGFDQHIPLLDPIDNSHQGNAHEQNAPQRRHGMGI